MSEDPKSYNHPDGEQLRPTQIDDVARALLSLTREVCVLTDRLAVLEAVLDQHGIDVSQAVDTHQPDDTLQQKITERTTTIIEDIVSALSGRQYRRDSGSS